MLENVTNIKVELAKSAAVVEAILEKSFDGSSLQPRLLEAMKYSLLSGGKRLRGVIALWACEIVAGQVNKDAELAVMALEMVHCYSLIHDDLPAMDDDDFRRGRPSSHKKFDEATAILAGDSLLTYAFEVLTRASTDTCAVKMIRALATAAGPEGMVAGQMADIEAEKSDPEMMTLKYIHTNKTAQMFKASAVMGGIAGGASEEQLDALGQFGLKMGLCFQVADDILDMSSTSEELGKTAGKDAIQGKMTYPALMGLEKAKEVEEQLAQSAVEKLHIFGDKAEILKQLVVFLIGRKK